MMSTSKQMKKKSASSSTSQEKDMSKDEDTRKIASFLLSLKHRSVTPEPLISLDELLSSPLPHHSHQERAFNSLPPALQYSPPSSSASSLSGTDSGSSSNNSLMDAAGLSSSSLLLTEEPLNLNYETLLADSKLVFTKDRDLVPDCLFLAMAQMKPCRLQHADRVGCYKSREIGFVGMCCKHCSGQPGFGRYYPNSVRSLAQTTTSQTILKHIGNKCRFCPPHIRNAVLELQRQQAVRDGNPTGRPRYGSRKIFFQRVWQRLHGQEILNDLIEEERMAPLQLPPAPPAPSTSSRVKSPPTACATGSSEEDEDVTSVESPLNSDAEEDDNHSQSTDQTANEDVKGGSSKRKANHRYGALPMSKSNKRRKSNKKSNKSNNDSLSLPPLHQQQCTAE